MAHKIDSDKCNQIQVNQLKVTNAVWQLQLTGPKSLEWKCGRRRRRKPPNRRAQVTSRPWNCSVRVCVSALCSFYGVGDGNKIVITNYTTFCVGHLGFGRCFWTDFFVSVFVFVPFYAARIVSSIAISSNQRCNLAWCMSTNLIRFFASFVTKTSPDNNR